MSISSVVLSPHEWSALYRRDDGEQQPISPVERELGAESFGRRHGLEIIRAIVEVLGNPQRHYPIVHVGGSKGKGSTVAILSSILRAAGYRVGMYTSPSLTNACERIQVDGRSISDAETQRHLDRMRPIWHDFEERPRFFEATTAIAFEHFKEQGVDVAVVEVGLGGRLDATNVVQPEVAIITSIELEHTQVLGDTLAAIAGEKAGIIKHGVPTITGVTDAEPLETIEQKCDELRSPLWRLGRDFVVEHVEGGVSEQRFDVKLSDDLGGERLSHLRLGLAGDAQNVNATLAVVAARLIRERFDRITDSSIRDGLSHANWPGRLELIAGRPAVLLDVAHTPASARQLRRYLDRFFRQVPKTLVLGMLRDKRFADVAGEFVDAFDRIIVAPVKWFRSMDAEQMQAAFEPIRSDVETAPTICSAVQHALRGTPADGLVVVAGSLFAVGEAKRRFGWSERTR